MTVSAPADYEIDEAVAGGPSSHQRDLVVIGLVASCFMAARLLTWMPLAVVVVVVVLGVFAVRPRVVVLALFLLVGWHAGHDLDGLEPVTTRPLSGVDALLTSDPRSDSQLVSVQAEIAGDRVLVSARAMNAAVLRGADKGDHVQLSGTIRGARPSTSWRISRRIVGQVTVTKARLTQTARGPTGAANALRHVVRSGARTLSRDRQVLFTGLVFGDDRGQDPIVADNFRAAGLGHLLAVSGQNVVFVLLLAAPVLGRISSVAIRVGLSFGLLAGFGFMTRFEPSVSRALVMAGLALIAHAVGRPANAATLLPPAVLGLVLFDPLLAWSLAFQLSVAATLGLVILTPRIAAMLPGSNGVVLAVSATIGAQAAVSPLLITTFGTISAVAAPANLLAGPAAAGVMMWGLVAGTIAGVSPPPIAEVLHIPTRVMLWWIHEVAEFFARWPVGQVRGVHMVALCAVAVGWSQRHRVGLGMLRPFEVLMGGVVLATIVVMFAAPRQLRVGSHRLLDGLDVIRSESGHDVVIVHKAQRPEAALEALRQARLGSIDLVVAEVGTRDVGRLVHLFNTRFDVAEIWAPANHEVPGATTVEPLAGTIGSISIATGPDGAITGTVVKAPTDATEVAGYSRRGSTSIR